VDRCEKMIKRNLNGGNVPSSTKAEETDYIINGKNVMKLPASGACSFAFQLLDMLFSKEELGKSLVYQARKSDKPALDETRIEKLMFLVNKRYGDKDD